MTEIQKKEFIKKVLKLVEGRLVISSHIKTKLKDMGFLETKINRNDDHIISGQVKYDFQGFDIAIGITSRSSYSKRLIMGIKFDSQ